MLQIHSGNRLEALLGVFLTRTVNPADPLEAQTLIVQNAGMARWIAQQTAIGTGICANMATHSPGTFLWNLPARWDEGWREHSDWSKDVLQWRIYAAIPALLSRPSFAELARYLQRDASGAGLFQLAQKIADVFDRYLVYRADLIAAWEAGDEQHWQAQLWRAIRTRHNDPHWGDVARIVAAHAAAGSAPNRPFPARIALFGVSSLPPVHLQLLHSLAVFTEVDLYYLNPSRAYWADLVDERGQARRRARALKAGQDDPTGLLDLGNPLLASWGLAGQAFLDQLLESGALDEDYFSDPHGEWLLHHIQRDMLELIDRSDAQQTPLEIADGDRSIQVHSAHSALREVQILHDQLLQLFEQLERLQPREIIVMAPNIEQYAPFIEATFSVVPEQQDIPWTIADRPMRREQQLLEILAQLLAMPESRFEAAELLSLLDVPAVARRLGLNPDTLGQLRLRVAESGIRWSLNAAMREALELPADAANSWDFGLQRLFTGFAMPADSDALFAGVAPYVDVEGGDAEQLAVLQQLLDLCLKWNARLRAPHSLGQWLEVVDQLLRDFFALDDEEQYVVNQLRDQLRERVEQASDAGVESAVARQVLLELLGNILDDDSNSRNFLNGAVTFSNMVPMRSIPFRVVCLLGMNATAFPRDDRPLPFDLIAQAPRRGDRARHSDDRYLFLETLLSAREVFYLSYIGRDARDNSPRAPATVIEELQRYIGDAYRASAPLAATVEHPLQPFSQRYFSGQSAALSSYKPHWFDAAGVAAEPQTPVFYDDPPARSEAPPALVDIADFCGFFCKPSQTFLRDRFGVSSYRADDSLQVSEPFALNGLEQWALKQSILARLDRGFDAQTVYQRLRAEGVLPAGASGEQVFGQLHQVVGEYRQRLEDQRVEPLPALAVDIDLGALTLTGVLGNVSARGLVLSRLGSWRAADFLDSWIRHLVLNVLAPDGVACQTVAVAESESWVFAALPNAAALLAELAQIYQRAQSQPLALFPDTSLAFARAQAVGGDAARAANLAWQGGDKASGEGQKPEQQILWRGRDPLGEDFVATAERVFGPMLAAARKLDEREST